MGTEGMLGPPSIEHTRQYLGDNIDPYSLYPSGGDVGSISQGNLLWGRECLVGQHRVSTYFSYLNVA